MLEDGSTVTTDECCAFGLLAEARVASGLDPTDALRHLLADLRARVARLPPEHRSGYLHDLEANRRAVAIVREHLGETISG